MTTRKKHTCESFEIYLLDGEFEFDKMNDLLEHFHKLNDHFNITCLSINSTEIFRSKLDE